MSVYESVTVTDQVNVSLTLAPTRPWQDKWYETIGCLAGIEEIYQRGAPGTDNPRRVVEAFFKACRELADWIEQSAGKGALEHVHSDPDLMICDAFAQTIKHHTRENSASMIARISKVAEASSGIRMAIAWKASSHAPEYEVDCVELARRCVTAWERFFLHRKGSPCRCDFGVSSTQ